MKKYVMISIVCMSALSGYLNARDTATINDKVFSAIDDSDVVLLKRLLRRVGDITQKDKEAFINAAADAVDEREQSRSFLKSRLDLAKFVLGIPLSLIGGLYGNFALSEFSEGLESTGYNVQQKKDKAKKYKEAARYGIISTLFLPLGLYLTVKGLKCSTATNRLKDAEKIEELVEALVVAGQKTDSTLPKAEVLAID